METVILPGWTVGPGCYKEVYDIVSRYGKNVAVIGGKTALSKAYGKIKEALKDTDLVLSDPIIYGTEATYENAAVLQEMDIVKNADMLFAVGGGKANDTVKCAAFYLDKPVFSFPTLSSNCAGCTGICVMYNTDGSYRNTLYLKRCAVHTFIDTDIVVDSPKQYLIAGIGDSLAKEFECEYASRNAVNDFSVLHTPYLGVGVSKSSTRPYIQFGKKAAEQIENKKSGYELEQVALDIIITAGLISNLTIDNQPEHRYFYNSSVAHCFYNAYTVTPDHHKHLHGEIVAFGILVLLTMDNNVEKREELFRFFRELGLPMTMEELDLKEEHLPAVARKAHEAVEWDCAPFEMTDELLIQAILDEDKAAKEWLSVNK